MSWYIVTDSGFEGGEWGIGSRGKFKAYSDEIIKINRINHI